MNDELEPVTFESDSANPVLHHVTVKTQRLDEMVDWYSRAVGMRVMYAFPGGVGLTNDSANHRLAFLTTPAISDDPDKLRHSGMHHTSFEYPSGEGLLRSYERLRDLGIVPHAALDHGMTVSFYYVDPDGNSVELQYDVYGDWEKSSEWMRTSPDFARDPIGTPIDPEQMIAAWHGGADFDELHRRARGGEFLPEGELDLRLPT